MERIHGTATVHTHLFTKSDEGEVVEQKGVEERRVCGHPEAKSSAGDCRIVVSPWLGDHSAYTEFEHERLMKDLMSRGSP